MIQRIDIDGFKSQLDFLTVVSDLGVLPDRKIGNHYQGDCPTGHPSEHHRCFTIWPATERWHCFHCGKRGDVIDLVMTKNNLSFTDACNWLSDRYNLRRFETVTMTPEERAEREARLADQAEIFDILTEAAHFYHECLLNDAEMLDHLRQHYGLNDETIATHSIGYSTGEGLYEYLRQKGMTARSSETGLLLMRKWIVGLKEFFEHRLVLPYWNAGKVVYFIGRKTERTPDGDWEKAKYKKLPVRSPECQHISEHIENSRFFGEDTIKGSDNVFVAEGIMDCLAMLQAGYPTISPGTTRFSSKDLPRLERLTRRAKAVYLVPDAEESGAGLGGALDTAARLEGCGPSVYIVNLPREEGVEKVDAAEFLRDHGKEAFEKVVDHAKTPLQLEIDAVQTENVNEAQLLDRLSPLLEKLRAMPESRREIHLGYLRENVRLAPGVFSALKRELKHTRKPSSRKGEGEEKVEYAARFKALVDLVLHEGKIQYLVNTGDDLFVIDCWRADEGETYLLPPPEIGQVPFDLLPADLILGKYHDSSQHTLYDRVVRKLREVAVLASDEHYHLCAVFIFFTYLAEQAPYYPYLWFFGLPERGKSRITKAVIQLSYRGLYSETLREAYLFRFAEHFGGTLGLDLYELSNRAQKQGSHDLLLGRFEKGMKIARVTNPDKGPFQDTRYYAVSGPTVLATNVEIPLEDPLRSRCIRVVMPEARGIYPNNNTVEELQGLKAELLVFRARRMYSRLPAVEKPIAGRLGDVIQPLLAVAALVSKEADRCLRSLVRELDSARRAGEAESMPGRIVQLIYGMRGELKGGRLPVSRLQKKLNEGIENDRFKLSPQRVGKELSALGISTRKIGGYMMIEWNESVMSRLRERFMPEENSLPTLPTVPDEDQPSDCSRESAKELSPKSSVEDEPWA
jgi:DNA primase catalytic core